MHQLTSGVQELMYVDACGVVRVSAAVDPGQQTLNMIDAAAD